MHKPLQVQVSDVHPLFLLIPEQPAPATGRHPFQKPMGLCSDTLGHLELSLLHFRALQQDTELNKTTKPTTQSKLSAVGHSILLFQVFFRYCSVDILLLLPPSHLLVQTSHLSFFLQLSQACFVWRTSTLGKVRRH